MKKNVSKSLIGLLLLTSVGCGKSFDGTYTGTETVSQSGLQAQSENVTIQVNGSDSSVTGTWTGSTYGTGNFTGTQNGDSISNVVLTVNSTANTGGYSYGGGSNYGCGNVQYTGTLSVSNNQLTGTLTANTPAPTPTPAAGQQPYNYQGSNCSGTRTVTANKSN